MARRGTGRAVGLALALAVGLMAGGTAAATAAGAAAATAAGAATVPDPVSTKAAPAVVEGYSPYLPQRSCDPTLKAGTTALRALLLATYGGRDLGITRACTIGALSEHKEGRAFDWGLNSAVPAEKAIATQFLTWLLATGPAGEPGYNAKRLGVMYVIWNGKIWGGYRAAEGWRTYSGGEAHAGHIHISLSWNGATKRSSWWSGKAAPVDFGPCPAIEGEMAPRWTAPRLTPCPAPIPIMSLTGRPVLRLNVTSPYVKQLQRLLKVSPVSGFFGPVTDAALRAYQASHGLAVTGTTTAATWAAVRNPATPTTTASTSTGTRTSSTPSASVTPTLLSRMSYTVRPGDSLSRIASTWRSNVRAIMTVNHLTTSKLRIGQVLSLPVKSWLTRYSRTTLRTGSRGSAVKALQVVLRMPVKYRTGTFGSLTRAAVQKVEARWHWKPDGVVTPSFWVKLGG